MKPTEAISNESRAIGRWLLVLAVVIAIGRVFDGFEEDELQHLHSAWLVGGGMVPYRDYFDHHMPLFHVLFALPTRWIGANYALLYAAARAMALATALGTLALFMRLSPGGRVLAALAGVFIISSRFVDYVFLLRPDFIALFLLILASTLATRETPPPFRCFLTGACVGLAVLATQKSIALAPAFVLWPFAFACHSRGRELRWWLLRALALLCGMLVPMLALVTVLAHLGALVAFLHGPVGFVSHYHQGNTTRWVLQEPLLFGWVPLALGLAWAIRATWLLVRHGQEQWIGDGLLGLLAVCGTAGFLLTPAPTVHAYVFTAVWWVLACSVRGIVWMTLLHQHRDAPRGHCWLVGMCLLLLLLPLRPYNVAITLALWAIVAVIWRRFEAKAAYVRGESQARRLLAACCVIGVLGSVASVAERAIHARVFPQLAAMRRVNKALPPHGCVMTTWPIMTPAQPHATYHWFSDRGTFSSLPHSVFEREYEQALDRSDTCVVVCNPRVLSANVPAVWRRMTNEWQDMGLPPGGLKGIHAYVRKPPRPDLLVPRP